MGVVYVIEVRCMVEKAVASIQAAISFLLISIHSCSVSFQHLLIELLV